MVPRVLIVEEHAALREGYERSLRDEGYEVLTAASTDGLLELVRSSSPDLVVLDPEGEGGKGMASALQLIEANVPASLVFNTSKPYTMEIDFSTWVADAFAVRSQGVDGLLRAVQQVLPRAVANS